MDWKEVLSIFTNPYVLGFLGLAAVFVIDHVVKATKGKTDDAWWAKLRQPVMNFLRGKVGKALCMAALLLVPLSLGCVGTVTKTNGDKVTTVTMAWGNAGVSTGSQCNEEDGKCLQVKGGAASEGFLQAITSPLGAILKGLLAGL